RLCAASTRPDYRMRRRGPVGVRSRAHVGRRDAEFEPDDARETTAAVASFVTDADPAADRPASRATLAIDLSDCIGCEVCVAHCDQGVLRMVDGKALVDLRQVNHCDLDGECVKVCPTNVVSLKVV